MDDDTNAEVATLTLTIPVKAARVIPTQSRSPGNELLDIIEFEIGLPNDGNCPFMRPMDHARFQIERGQLAAALKALKADGLLKTMGLK